MPYAQLAERLGEIGVVDSEPDIRNKLERVNSSGVLDPMPRSDWRLVLTTFVGVGSLASLYGYYLINKSSQYGNAEYHYQPAIDSSRPKPLVAGQPQPNRYDPHCDQPQSSGDSDLCAQWSAVEAVNESNRLVRLGILVSYIVGAFGFLATGAGALLVYRSLRQNDAALSHASETAKTELRPWLTVEIIPINIDLKTTGISVEAKARVKNIGRTPATKVRCTTCIVNGMEDIDGSLSKKFADRILTPHGDTVLPNDEVDMRFQDRMSAEKWKPIDAGNFGPPSLALRILIDVRYYWGSGEFGQTFSHILVGTKLPHLGERFLTIPVLSIGTELVNPELHNLTTYRAT